MLIEIVRQRLIEERRTEMAADISASRNAYGRGKVSRGTDDDLMNEF